MKNAQEMYEMSYGKGWFKSWTFAHFALIEEDMDEKQENAQLCFTGLVSMPPYLFPLIHKGNWAFAVTEKRIMFAQEHIIGSTSKSLFLNAVRDVTYKRGIYFGVIIIDAVTERIEVAFEKNECKKAVKKLMEILGRGK